MSLQYHRRNFALLLIVALAFAGCGKSSGAQHTDTGQPDAGLDAGPDASSSDAAMVDAPADMAADVTPDASTGELCSPCTDSSECGGPDDQCITLFDNLMSCGRACTVNSDCPADYFCATVDQTTMVQQCVPKNLTCVDRCSAVTCDSGKVCDPLTGDCVQRLHQCDTGCDVDAVCGDSDADVCVSVPGTPDNERSCMLGCDPQAMTSECPADYVCYALDPTNAPNSGICYPIAGTCEDRCQDVDCAKGSNCNPVTGGCEASQYGPCDPGCMDNAQCGAQDDLCLDLGINTGAHCWQSCANQDCPDGYQCQGIVGTTLRICIPLTNDCSACDNNACFPDSVCNPVDGTCQAVSRPCASNSDCAAGTLCDPVSQSCVAIGRPCAGASWAVDCDNAVTKCTTQRAGTTGTCEAICINDSDCAAGEHCASTNIGKFCLGDELGGAETCGTLYPAGSAVGTACNPQSCFSSATICTSDANIDGFCSTGCTSDAQCTGGATCQVTDDGTSVCLLPNCACAEGHGLSSDVNDALNTAWAAIDQSQCDVAFEPRTYAGLSQVDDLAFTRTAVERRVRYPIATLGQTVGDLATLDAATSGPGAALRASLALADVDITPTVKTYSYPGSQNVLAQAVGALVTAAGGVADLAALDTATSNVPAAVQPVAARIVSATADALIARNGALQGFGWSATDQQAIFDAAPYLLLPGTTAQTALAPDLTDPTTRTLWDHDLAAALGPAAGNLAASVNQAVSDASGLGSQPTFATVVVDTPAGKVVIGDGGDTTYDAATLGSDIAVLVDIGGNDTYRISAGANGSVANGVSVLVDLGGSDDYGYTQVADPNDGANLLPSDADGRTNPTQPLNLGDGPTSLSTAARQGAGRLGIGMLVDVGAGTDTYRSLRMSQGAAVFGIGLLWDDGAADFHAEALSQGAALDGLGVLWAEGSNTNSYQVWSAGQGFGSAGGVGLAYDRGGDDSWTAEPGAMGTVLYYSKVDRGVSNRSLAQGAAVGELGKFAAGTGVLRDAMGTDHYLAGTFAQAYAKGLGFAVAADGAGADTWDGRALVEGVGEWRAGAILYDAAGDDVYGANAPARLIGQGVGQTLGWGAFVDGGGSDEVHFLPSGGGVGVDGGFGLAIGDGGDDTYTVGSDASWGFAQTNAAAGDPGYGALTVGIFADTAGTDTYQRPTTTGIGDQATWLQPATPTSVAGVGVDR